MAKYKIDFNVSVCIEADSLEEAKDKFQAMKFIAKDDLGKEHGLTYEETTYVENADTYDECTNEFQNLLIR